MIYFFYFFQNPSILNESTNESETDEHDQQDELQLDRQFYNREFADNAGDDGDNARDDGDNAGDDGDNDSDNGADERLENVQHVDVNDSHPEEPDFIKREYNPSLSLLKLSLHELTLNLATTPHTPPFVTPRTPLYHSTPQRRMSTRQRLAPIRLTY